MQHRTGPHGHRGNSDCLRFGLPLPGNASKMALKTSGVCSLAVLLGWIPAKNITVLLHMYMFAVVI